VFQFTDAFALREQFTEARSHEKTRECFCGVVEGFAGGDYVARGLEPLVKDAFASVHLIGQLDFLDVEFLVLFQMGVFLPPFKCLLGQLKVVGTDHVLLHSFVELLPKDRTFPMGEGRLHILTVLFEEQGNKDSFVCGVLPGLQQPGFEHVSADLLLSESAEAPFNSTHQRVVLESIQCHAHVFLLIFGDEESCSLLHQQVVLEAKPCFDDYLLRDKTVDVLHFLFQLQLPLSIPLKCRHKRVLAVRHMPLLSKLRGFSVLNSEF